MDLLKRAANNDFAVRLDHYGIDPGAETEADETIGKGGIARAISFQPKTDVGISEKIIRSHQQTPVRRSGEASNIYGQAGNSRRLRNKIHVETAVGSDFSDALARNGTVIAESASDEVRPIRGWNQTKDSGIRSRGRIETAVQGSIEI